MGRSSRGYKNTQSTVALRRKEAEKRQEEYNKLSLKEKLDRLTQGHCERQRSRLMALMNKPVKVVVEEPSAESLNEVSELNASKVDMGRKLKAKDRRKMQQGMSEDD